MIALDINVLARLVTNDDKAQALETAALIDSGTALLVPTTVLLELEWVLRGAYQLDNATIAHTFEHLLSIRNLSFERQSVVEMALQHYAIAFNFADELHHCTALSCNIFDKNFKNLQAKLS
jgi:predicted nucleic-acid-binding protein